MLITLQTRENHTPGPWTVGNNEPDYVFAACDEDGRQFGRPIFAEPFRGYGSLAHEKPSRESIANARLIAAAPELLEALIALTNEAHRNMVGGAGHLIDDACAAIAKARGEA